jgi:RNA polymerase sigma-70 factor (ECF subfamily)
LSTYYLTFRLIRIFTHIADFKYKKQGSLKTWASKIIANEALRFLRKQQELMEQAIDQTDVPEEDDPPIEDIPPEVIQEMIRQLPTGYRTVFNLYVFEDKTHEEIARLLGISINTSSSQLCRAKNLLAKMIKANSKKISNDDERTMEKTDAAENGRLSGV